MPVASACPFALTNQPSGRSALVSSCAVHGPSLIAPDARASRGRSRAGTPSRCIPCSARRTRGPAGSRRRRLVACSADLQRRGAARTAYVGPSTHHAWRRHTRAHCSPQQVLNFPLPPRWSRPLRRFTFPCTRVRGRHPRGRIGASFAPSGPHSAPAARDGRLLVPQPGCGPRPLQTLPRLRPSWPRSRSRPLRHGRARD